MIKKITIFVFGALIIAPFVFAHDDVPDPHEHDARRDIQNERRDAQRIIKDERRAFVEETKNKREEVHAMIKDKRGETKDLVRERRDAMKSASTTPADREEFRRTLQAKHAEIKTFAESARKSFKDEFEARREEVKETLDAHRTALKEKLSLIRDEHKRTIVEGLQDKFDHLNDRLLKNYTRFVDRLEDLLLKIISRTDKAETAGRDVAMTRTAITTAEGAIQSAREAIASQASNTYSIEVTDEEGLRSDVSTVRKALQDDLKIVRDSVRTARDAVRDAARALHDIPRIDTVEEEGNDMDDSEGDENNEAEE